MTGIEDATPDDYSGWNDFGNYGSCGLEDRSWYSAAPLSDVVIYDSGFTGGDATVHYANGAGDWRKNEQTSTDTCCYDVYPGFFGAPNNANRDEVSDLLFYYPGSRTYTRTEPGSSARALRA